MHRLIDQAKPRTRRCSAHETGRSRIRFSCRLRDGATADDAKCLAVHLDSVFEDVQMMWVEGGPDGGSRVPVVVPIRRAA